MSGSVLRIAGLVTSGLGAAVLGKGYIDVQSAETNYESAKRAAMNHKKALVNIASKVGDAETEIVMKSKERESKATALAEAERVLKSSRDCVTEAATCLARAEAELATAKREHMDRMAQQKAMEDTMCDMDTKLWNAEKHVVATKETSHPSALLTFAKSLISPPK
mmetsp:Transcript_12861/g.17574  ORF Transcript_12861/g.17574 Transcript_12861/m.17574 type:complete len:165 (-) Transcript_12861:105-599(-)|eukprot:CAMPEP_0196580518 /NCGR_PEP_ID=MMETSP1081-20130531/28977_1 /TAXON_ID=36882 /ORGANISM="Pyramimonas amylifera, Strain CCMP720" /LENGTH=164 /DNA_ID=CAMNT_0041900399 /DNA_START=116 /DNA_END=610 /DNA_ORIENTATION=-